MDSLSWKEGFKFHVALVRNADKALIRKYQSTLFVKCAIYAIHTAKMKFQSSPTQCAGK